MAEKGLYTRLASISFPSLSDSVLSAPGPVEGWVSGQCRSRHLMRD